MAKQDNYYDEDLDQPIAASDSGESSGASKDKEYESDEQPFLVPKSAFMGKQIDIGEEYIFRVTGIHDDEVSLVYATEPSYKEEQEPAMKDDSGGLYD